MELFIGNIGTYEKRKSHGKLPSLKAILLLNAPLAMKKWK